MPTINQVIFAVLAVSLVIEGGALVFVHRARSCDAEPRLGLDRVNHRRAFKHIDIEVDHARATDDPRIEPSIS